MVVPEHQLWAEGVVSRLSRSAPASLYLATFSVFARGEGGPRQVCRGRYAEAEQREPGARDVHERERRIGHDGVNERGRGRRVENVVVEAWDARGRGVG
jgi:hypothetical protein